MSCRIRFSSMFYCLPARCALELGDIFCLQKLLKAFGAALATRAAISDAAEWRFRKRRLPMVNANRTPLEGLRCVVQRARTSTEDIRRHHHTPPIRLVDRFIISRERPQTSHSTQLH